MDNSTNIDDSTDPNNVNEFTDSENLYYTLYLKYPTDNYKVGDYLYFNIYDEDSS
jgi:hypothetical protein